MKNLLSKLNPFSEKQVQATQVPQEHKPASYPKEVYEIHHAFETAGESILEEARMVLKDCQSKSIDKGKRLLSLGFKQSTEAVTASGILTKELNAKEISELVMDYKVKYPNNKFITEKQVEAICLKWGLVCGDIGIFKGFVPEKNLEQIESFSKKYKFGTYRGEVLSDYADHKRGEIITLSLPGFMVKKGGSYYHLYNEKGKLCFQSDDGEIFYGHQRDVDLGLGGLFLYRMRKEGLKICAPLTDMDTTGMDLNGYHLEKHIPDPVVLQPVKGGYLIVTAWGDEASDENVVNEAMN